MKVQLQEVQSAKPRQVDDEHRKPQDVVVRGFKEKQPADVLVKRIEELLTIVRGGTQGVKVEIPSDPGNFGFMQFTSFDEKLAFYKTVNQKRESGELESELFFTDKLSWEDRVVEKKSGYIKHHLMAHYSKDTSDVRINWRKKYVEMNGKKVASFSNGHTIKP